ncbi:MAG: hypothetical protein K9L17_09610 [Clostridiales bacterium]|nr:hypothetical protein [Clostridiales bacterium]MCF8022935.1 hypothetical protein [Clostridiales bacterium]
MKKLIIAINCKDTESILHYLQEHLAGIINVTHQYPEFCKISFNPHVVDSDQIIAALLERGFTINYFCEIA